MKCQSGKTLLVSIIAIVFLVAVIATLILFFTAKKKLNYTETKENLVKEGYLLVQESELVGVPIKTFKKKINGKTVTVSTTLSKDESSIFSFHVSVSEPIPNVVNKNNREAIELECQKIAIEEALKFFKYEAELKEVVDSMAPFVSEFSGPSLLNKKEAKKETSDSLWEIMANVYIPESQKLGEDGTIRIFHISFESQI